MSVKILRGGVSIRERAETTGELISSGYAIWITSSGIATDTTITDSGSARVVSGGITNVTRVLSGGTMYVYERGEANNTAIYGSGRCIVSSGGIMNRTTVNGNDNGTAFLHISNGGIANSTTVNSEGKMSISSGGMANDTTVTSGGKMYLSSGSVQRGSLQIASGAVVSAEEGSTIDFTLTDRTPEDGYLINDLSLITGAPTYTITVSANQASGVYKLAQGASSFSGSITIGTETENYGTLTVNGEALNHQDAIYSLVKEDGNLLLKIDQPAVFIYSSGTLVSSGSVVTGETLVEGMNDSMHISSGGVASETTVSSGGKMYISNGGVASDTTVNSGGSMTIFEGGVASSTAVNQDGKMYISARGIAEDTFVSGFYKWGGDMGQPFLSKERCMFLRMVLPIELR